MIMKNFLTYLVCLSVLFGACRRETDPVFDKSPDERINETLTKYQAVLSDAPDGWNATLETSLGISFSFYFRFNDSNRVVMYSDFDSTTATVMATSSYRLKALQQPCLLFDTYSYIHLLADPDARVNGGYFGGGLFSDFEFSLDSVTTDHISLTGRFNRSKAIFTKATAAQRQAWENKKVWEGIQKFKSINKIQNYFKRLNYNGVDYEVRFDTVFKRANITWLDGRGVPQFKTVGYYFTEGGVVFNEPLVNGDATIEGFSVDRWDAGSSTIYIKVSGSAATITGAIKPLVVDKEAARRWWQLGANNELYYASRNGFHVNGVDDAFNIRSLKTDSSTFYYLVYLPGAGVQGGQTYDIMLPFYYEPARNALNYYYGTAQRALANADGRMSFSYVGDLLIGPHPVTGPAELTRTQLYNTSGYWFVQTGETTFDMVGARDAKTWITWELVL